MNTFEKFEKFSIEKEKMNKTKGAKMPDWLQEMWDATPENGGSYWVNTDEGYFAGVTWELM